MEFGRYIRSGAIELALGTMAAEKLKVGIPSRPYTKELSELAESVSFNQEEKDFILSLYEPLEVTYSLFVAGEKSSAGNARMVLKKNIPQADMRRWWDILDRSGRNDVQISAVIDIKAAPEKIRSDKWEGELMPALSVEEQTLMMEAYQYDELMDIYLINEDVEADQAMAGRVLEAMIRGGFSGAVRHVNQLFSAIVVGVVNSPDPVTNANTAYIPLDVLQGEEGMMLEGHITEILIRHKNGTEAELPGKNESAAAITTALEQGLAKRGMNFPPELAIFTWMDYVRDYIGYEQLENSATKVLSGLLLLLAFLGISNTILLAILERTKEIGMMRAMGMTDSQMILVYMLEAGFLGFFGSILGIGAGCLLNYPMVKYGIDVSAMGEALGGGVGFRVTTLFRSMWNYPVIIGSGIAATILSSFMAFFPTRRAIKMPITDSLRFE